MKTARIFTDAFNRVIDATKQFVSPEGARSNKTLHYIRLEFDKETKIMTAIALDGYRMFVEHAGLAICEESFSAFIHKGVKLPRDKQAIIELDEDKNELMIRCGGYVCGLQQPDGDFVDWRNVIPKNETSCEIAFNGHYLMQALQAAKVSCGKTFKNEVSNEQVNL